MRKYRQDYYFSKGNNDPKEKEYKPTKHIIRNFNPNTEQYEYEEITINLELELENQNEILKDIMLERNNK